MFACDHNTARHTLSYLFAVVNTHHTAIIVDSVIKSFQTLRIKLELVNECLPASKNTFSGIYLISSFSATPIDASFFYYCMPMFAIFH